MHNNILHWAALTDTAEPRRLRGRLILNSTHFRGFLPTIAFSWWILCPLGKIRTRWVSRCGVRSEWLEGHEERMMYAEITTDTETIVMTTRTVLIGRGRWSRPTIWQLMLAPQQYLHHHHIPITNTRKYQVLPRNYIPASLNTPQFWLLSVSFEQEQGLLLSQPSWDVDVLVYVYKKPNLSPNNKWLIYSFLHHLSITHQYS